MKGESSSISSILTRTGIHSLLRSDLHHSLRCVCVAVVCCSIIYFLGTGFGRQAEWKNPAQTGLVQVSSSPLAVQPPSLPAWAALSRTPCRCVTQAVPDAWFLFDFLNVFICPTAYTLRHVINPSDSSLPLLFASCFDLLLCWRSNSTSLMTTKRLRTGNCRHQTTPKNGKRLSHTRKISLSTKNRTQRSLFPLRILALSVLP